MSVSNYTCASSKIMLTFSRTNKTLKTHKQDQNYNKSNKQLRLQPIQQLHTTAYILKKQNRAVPQRKKLPSIHCCFRLHRLIAFVMATSRWRRGRAMDLHNVRCKRSVKSAGCLGKEIWPKHWGWTGLNCWFLMCLFPVMNIFMFNWVYRFSLFGHGMSSKWRCA